MTERFWLSLPLACVGIAALSLPAMAQSGDESPFLLQEHGGVRILRGLDADKNFEATPAEEDEKAEAPEKEARPEKAASVASSKTKRTGIASAILRASRRIRSSNNKLSGSNPADRLANGGVRKSKIKVHGGNPADRLANGGVRKSKIRVH